MPVTPDAQVAGYGWLRGPSGLMWPAKNVRLATLVVSSSLNRTNTALKIMVPATPSATILIVEESYSSEAELWKVNMAKLG